MGQHVCLDYYVNCYDYNKHKKVQKITVQTYLSCATKQKDITANHFREAQYPLKIDRKVLKIQQNILPFHHSPQFIPFVGIQQIKSRVLNHNNFIYASKSQWKDGLPHGKGKLLYADGSLYIGYFYKGIPNGQGRLISPKGWYYQGQIINQQAEGKGLFCYEQIGYQYQGFWSNDLPNDRGKQTWTKPDKTKIIYQGQFMDGQKHGKGRYKSKQWEYQGPFLNNQITGTNGTIKYICADSYQGHFLKGKKHGFGIYRWANGSSYQGKYQNDKKQGYGIYTNANGDVFERKWKEDKREGQGFLIIKGNKFDGLWHHDKPISQIIQN